MVSGTFDLHRLALRLDTDDGIVDIMDRHVESVVLGERTYDVFATDVVGDVDDPTVIFGSGYSQFVSFFMVRTD